MGSNLTQQNKVYSVSEVTREIRASLEGAFTDIWVEGEVSNFNMHSSGHCYFSIKDSESVLSCVMFKGSAYKLKFKIADGMKIVCFGRVSVYGKRGQYQLYVEAIEPKGIGSLQQAFTQLKEKLSKEGLFDASHKLDIPYLPEKIGIITSPTGAAVRDILNILTRRFPNMHIMLYPVTVQGGAAAGEISEAIETFNALNSVDVIIVGRGGGSLEDLWAFNEEAVARAIYNSAIPIISAVGHEIDYTIADFVADMRAPTPSAAAELVVRAKDDIIEDIDVLKNRLQAALSNMVDMLKKHLEGITQRYAFKQPKFLIEQYQQRIDEHARFLSQGLSHFVEMRNERFRSTLLKLQALSPVAILSRGYSITTTCDDGAILKDAARVKKGTRIKTRLAKGEIVSEVK